MSFFVDDFFDELDKGSLEDAKLLSEKWDEIFLRKELWQNAEVLDEEESSEKEMEEDFKKKKNSSQEGTEENQESDNESGDMSDDDLKVAVAASFCEKNQEANEVCVTMLNNALKIVDWFRGKDSSVFKSGDAQIAVAGTEEDNIEVCYKKGNAELAFYFNGDDLDIDELDDTDDEYDTGIYIFQKLYMALKIDGETEIEFLRIRKKDRHAIRENDITLTEFLNYFAPYYGFTDFPESFAEHALRFMQRMMKVAQSERQKKEDEETAKAEAERKEKDDADFQRKEELLKGI